MRYVVTGFKGEDRLSPSAHGEAAALDLIDDFVAAGFRIEKVEDEGGVIDAMLLMERLYAEDDAAREKRDV